MHTADTIPQIFDRKLLRQRREKAASRFAEFDFLHKHLAEHLADRLLDVKREFYLALDIGSGLTNAAKEVISDVIFDEEFLPFGANTFDLVLSSGRLHTINDLPGTLLQLNNSLKPDGLLLATIYGEETLKELRESFKLAEMEIEGGISPRVLPFVSVQDAGGLLQRAGFALPIVDTEKLTVTYENAFSLMKDLRGMAESNILQTRRRNFSRRKTFFRMAEIYAEKFADSEGRIPATFEIITMTAWKKHESQQKPLARGSGKTSLKDALE